MSAHTPTPWHVEAYEVYDSQDLIIADCGLMDDLKMVEANAARIVQCVNEHDGLIEQIESLRAERDGLVEALREIKKTFWQEKYVLQIATQTLAKYEK